MKAQLLRASTAKFGRSANYSTTTLSTLQFSGCANYLQKRNASQQRDSDWLNVTTI